MIMFSIGQLSVDKCAECGQPLPERYQPPADEDWTTGIFGCAEDPESCKRSSAVSLFVFFFLGMGGGLKA